MLALVGAAFAAVGAIAGATSSAIKANTIKKHDAADAAALAAQIKAQQAAQEAAAKQQAAQLAAQQQQAAQATDYTPYILGGLVLGGLYMASQAKR